MRVLLIILIILAVVLFFPAAVRVYYREGVVLRLYVFCVPITVIPKKEKKPEKPKGRVRLFFEKLSAKIKESFAKIKKTLHNIFVKIKEFFKKLFMIKDKPKKKKAPKKDEKPEKKESALKSLMKEEGVSGLLSLFGMIAKAAGSAVGRLLKGLVIVWLDLDIAVGAEDADKAAVTYGELCAVIYPLLGIIFSAFGRHRERISIRPDFLSEKIDICLDALVLVFPGLVLWQVIRLGLSVVFGLVRRKIKKAKEKTTE